MEHKILMLGWGYPPEIDGGLDVHVANLFEELRAKGLDVTLALPEDRAPDKEHVIPLEFEGDDMVSKASDISRQVVKLAEDYDLVHTHDWFGAESGLKAKKYSDVKWVATFHSTASGRSRNPPRRIQELERAMVERSDISIAVSNSLAEEVEKLYGKRPVVVHNGFSSSDARGDDIKQELGVEGKMVLYVGRHAEQKGIEHLVYGFSKLLEEKEATLVIGGEGHMTGALNDFVEMLGIEKNVIFVGFIPEEELGDYYSSSDVFVSPSIDEPFGLTVTEALEAGTPVVATASGAEEVLPGGVIIKAEPESNSIRDGILKSLERDELAEYKSRTWKEVAEETLELYQKL